MITTVRPWKYIVQRQRWGRCEKRMPPTVSEATKRAGKTLIPGFHSHEASLKHAHMRIYTHTRIHTHTHIHTRTCELIAQESDNVALFGKQAAQLVDVNDAWRLLLDRYGWHEHLVPADGA